MSEFDGIEGGEAWALKLDELLVVADDVAENGDGAARRAVRTRLKEFVIWSQPASEEIARLDEIANAARTALTMSSIDDRIRSISERSGELAQITKEFRARAAEGRSRANLIALKPAHDVVATATATIKALKTLEAELSSVEDEDLLKRIKAVVSRLQSLRIEIESA